MKNRFSAIDIKAIVLDLHPLITNARLNNLFDLNQKTFILKFNQQSTIHKHLVLIESGIRIHSTDYDREKPVHPSQFTMKLRKHLRQRRLTNLKQLGNDRVIIFEFHGEPIETINYNLVCEFYSSGNLILTDNNWLILACLRLVKTNNTGRDAYPVSYCPGQHLDSIKNYTIPKQVELISVPDQLAMILAENPTLNTKKAIGLLTGFSAPIIEHALLSSRIDGSIKLREWDQEYKQLVHCIEIAQNVVNTTDFAGYIVTSETVTSHQIDDTDSSTIAQVYKDLQPIKLKQYEQHTVQTFTSFNLAADMYFSNLESQKSIQKLNVQTSNAQKRLDAVKAEQLARVNALIEQELTYVKQAELIEVHKNLVQSIIAHLNQAIASGLDWIELQKFIRDQQYLLTSRTLLSTSNPALVLMYIDRLELNQNQVILRLPNDLIHSDMHLNHQELNEQEDLSHLFHSDDDDNTVVQPSRQPQQQQPTLPILSESNSTLVPIDLSKSAMKNAEALYLLKKRVNLKQMKTLAAADKAITNASQKITHDLTASKTKLSNQTGLSKLRKQLWFEKFHWFISSENYLCLGGRDAQQNELLVKRYMEKGDVYVHADLHGAPCVLIKNQVPAQSSSFYVTIPPSTLAQAGNLALCQSKAWTSKIVTSAWWVWWDQVSKSAPTGEYISAPGAFIIRGTKNMLPPCQLVYGAAILFKLASPESIDAHLNDRSVRYSEDNEDAPSGELGDEQGQSIGSGSIGSESDDENRDLMTNQQVVNQDILHEDELISELNAIMLEDDADSSGNEQVDEDFIKFRGTSNTQSQEEIIQHVLMDESSTQDTTPDLVMKPRSGPPRLSAAARRQLKKNIQKHGTPHEVAPATPLKQNTEQAVMPANCPDPTLTKPGHNREKSDSIPVPVESTKPSVRGKRGKNKKRAAKYADQSDDERELAMALLKSDQGVQPKGKKEKRKAAVKAQKAELFQLRQQQKEAAQLKSAEQASEQGLNADVMVDDTDEILPVMGTDKIFDVLNTYTGQPLPSDELMYAVCVCAPYSTLLKYKYKVKLTPGSSKKGNSSKLCAQIFYKIANNALSAPGMETNVSLLKSACEREVGMIKAIPENEWSLAMHANVKISAPLLATVHKSAKFSRKKRAKAKDEVAAISI